MKRLLLTISTIAVISSSSMAQDAAAVDTSWKTGGIIGLNFTQVSLSNWAAGGQNSISGIALFNYYANYNKGKNIWDNSIDLGYGLTQNGDADPIKSEDKIDLATKYGRYAFKHWYYSALLGFKSQFTPGYNYPDDSTKISNFLAPAYITLALGMDYKPNDNFSVMIAPLTGRIIIVNDQDLADAGAYGVDPAEYNELFEKVKDGEKMRTEFGASIRALYKKDIIENVNLQTKLELFSNYLEDPQNIDVNWEVLISMKVNKYITATLATQLIYDDNTIIAVDNNSDGIIDEAGPRTQFKEVLGVGFSYKF
jgi:opacity protein-like surface antigen